MADVVPPAVRSRMMTGIRGKDTKPEMLLRRGLHARGFRYRLHVRSLPGTPDLTFPARGAVILVNGCFWHGHDCPLFVWPKTREEWWRNKIERNRLADTRAVSALVAGGWRVGMVWECALKGKSRRPLEFVIDSCASWLLSTAPTMDIRGLE